MSKLAKMVKDRTASAVPEDEKLKELEDKILDAIEPVLLKEKIADNRKKLSNFPNFQAFQTFKWDKRKKRQTADI